MDPGSLVPATLRWWKCKAQLHPNSPAETQNTRSPSHGSQKRRPLDPGFKQFWRRWPDQSHQAFIAWPESPGSSGSLLNKNPGLTRWSVETPRVLAGAKCQKYQKSGIHREVLRCNSEGPWPQATSESAPQLQTTQAPGGAGGRN